MYSQKNNYNKILTSLFLVSLLFFASFSIIYINSLNRTVPFVNANSGKLGVRLEVSVYDIEGNLKDRVIKDDDLILQNFIDFLTDFFTDNYPTDVECDLQDISDTTRTVIIHTTGTAIGTFSDGSSDTEDKGGFIGIGTGATAPDRDDYDLTAQEESLTQNDANYPAYSSVSGNVVCQATIVATDTYNVAEAGYFINWVDDSDTVYTFMLLHDIFNPVAVIPTDNIVVSYSIILDGAEFNRNFGDFLAVLLGTCVDGDQEYATLHDIAGQDVFSMIYHNTQGWIGQYDEDQDLDANIYFRISESSTEPTRTTNQITGIVESYYRPSPLPTRTDENTTIQTAITVSDDRDISASALYVYVPTTSVIYHECLFIHTTFTSVEVDVGTAINIIDVLTYT